MRYIVLFQFIFLLLLSHQSISQHRYNIKTNVLSLILSVPQASFEVGFGSNNSITLSGFRGSYTFISKSRIQGVNLLYRKYVVTNNLLSGLYMEVGPIMNGEYDFGKSKFKNTFGGRAGLGWQFGGGRWVFDLGAALAGTVMASDEFDANGLPTGNTYNKFQPFMRLNTSVGLRF